MMLKQDPILSAIDGRLLQRGSIVNFSSIQGTIAIPWSAAYTTTKHALIGLTRSASEDYAKDGYCFECGWWFYSAILCFRRQQGYYLSTWSTAPGVKFEIGITYVS